MLQWTCRVRTEALAPLTFQAARPHGHRQTPSGPQLHPSCTSLSELIGDTQEALCLRGSLPCVFSKETDKKGPVSGQRAHKQSSQRAPVGILQVTGQSGTVRVRWEDQTLQAWCGQAVAHWPASPQPDVEATEANDSILVTLPQVTACHSVQLPYPA